MKIVLATGIYPPDIGGPATYVRHLADELTKRGDEVIVITYGPPPPASPPSLASLPSTSLRAFGGKGEESQDVPWKVVRVSQSGGSLLRWRRYAKILKDYGSDADVIECFSSVSCGVPLRMARLHASRLPLDAARGKPKLLLRLGGDFTWERYTDLGRRRTLKDFTIKHPYLRLPMERLLKIFDHVVFSTRFQEKLYELAYRSLPVHSVIENALPVNTPSPRPLTFSETPSPRPPPPCPFDRLRAGGGEGESAGKLVHTKHDPFRLLYLGRFVKFKNLENLLRAVAGVPLATLTLVGEGPVGAKLSALARSLQLEGRVSVVPPVHGDHVQQVFGEHDLLVLPSLTEISPNAALEARAAGLPVLLTEENGLSEELRAGMIIRPLITVTDITKAILEADQRYGEFAAEAMVPFIQERGWDKVAGEHAELFQSLL